MPCSIEMDTSISITYLDRARSAVLNFFNAPADQWAVIFAANALIELLRRAAFPRVGTRFQRPTDRSPHRGIGLTTNAANVDAFLALARLFVL